LTCRVSHYFINVQCGNEITNRINKEVFFINTKNALAIDDYVLLIASATMSYICFATIKGINWSRWANLLCWSAAIIFFNYGTMTGLMIGGIFIFGLWYYLFKSAGVNGYYHGLGEENQQGQAS